ncbi:MAG: hypothetical protein QM687_16760 [Ferruginibacter sp.]
MQQENNKSNNRPSGFEILLEIFGWIQIFISPFLLAAIIACIFYFSVPGTMGLIISIILVITGAVTGIIMATKAWKDKGTIHFMSRVSASPELDKEKI